MSTRKFPGLRSTACGNGSGVAIALDRASQENPDAGSAGSAGRRFYLKKSTCQGSHGRINGERQNFLIHDREYADPAAIRYPPFGGGQNIGSTASSAWSALLRSWARRSERT